MIDVKKLEGLVSAIEGEAIQPQPSHANLARLIAVFCREIVSELSPEKPSETVTESSASTITETIDATPDEPVEPEHKKKKKHKK